VKKKKYNKKITSRFLKAVGVYWKCIIFGFHSATKFFIFIKLYKLEFEIRPTMALFFFLTLDEVITFILGSTFLKELNKKLV
jgi:hypothetical protein